MSSVGIIDYGAGNLKSIGNGVKKVGFEFEFAKDPEKIGSFTHLILPGVGSFGAAMEKLQKFKKPIQEFIGEGKPFLGVCIGIQLLFEESEENPEVKGLEIFKGTCKRFPDSVKIPHMGWNNTTLKKESPILEGVSNDDYFYFVHSYYAEPTNKEIIAASTDYALEFPSIIAQDNVYATQFHPEKSSEQGLRILKNYLSI
ncbi:imidazole glycerol phosphate synthase subunit HisH [Candidatus Altiarchaeota archaeon]